VSLDRISKVAGEVLRHTRRERALTLRDVESLSKGDFKPSALGAYERGERGITVARFCELATHYGIPADRLLADVIDALAGEERRHIVIDLNELSPERDADVKRVLDFIRTIRSRRRDLESDVITLRQGDLSRLAFISRVEPDALLGKLSPALREHHPS
jgi:transcriptional regulator with XRE-family HTH domain